MARAGMTFAWMGAAALAGLAALAAAPQAAAKGGGGGTSPPSPADTGSIYFEINVNSTDRRTCVMATDGTGKTQLGVTAPVRTSWPLSVPAAVLHGTPSERWFVQFRAVAGSTYPGGRQRYELFATNQAGAIARQLTSCDIEPETADGLTWAADAGVADAKVSYAGHVVASGGAKSDGGLYVLAVDWSALLAGTFAPGVPTAVAGLGIVQPNYAAGASLNLHDCWSPDGSQVAYVQINGDGKLYRIGADGANRQALWSAGVAAGPAWSSRNEIAFFDRSAGQNADLLRVNSDGTGVVRILADPGEWKSMYGASWSPNATHLVYTHQEMPKVGGSITTDPTKWIYDVRRVARDGTGDVSLTADVSAQVQVAGWRP